MLGLFLAAGAHLQAQTSKLNLFIWSEYIDPQIIKNFEKKFTCQVTVDLYEDESSMLAKLQGGGAALYDVVVPPGYLVPTMVKMKLLAPLRHQNIPNLHNLESRFLSAPYDVGNQYTVAYQWGTIGLYVRKPKGKAIEPSWALLFDPKQQLGPFLMMDAARETIGAALKYKGFSFNSTDVRQLKITRDLVLDAKRRSLGFESGVGGKNKVMARGAVAAMVYNGDAVRGMREDPDTVYVVPKEGSEIWVDNLAVLSQAPHRDLAEQFLNYILEPEVGAQLSNFNQFASPNQAAKPFLKPGDLQNPSIYPSKEMMSKLEFLQDLGSQARLYDEIWAQIKAK